MAALVWIMLHVSMVFLTVLLGMEIMNAGTSICPAWTEARSKFIKTVDIANMDMGKGVVKLNWDIEGCETGDPINGYMLEYREYGTDQPWIGGREYDSSARVGRQDELRPFLRYEFRVSALSRRGPCKPSDPVHVFPTSPPRNVKMVSFENGKLGLKWDLPEDDGGKVIMGYDVLYRKRNDPFAEWKDGVHIKAGKALKAFQDIDGDPNMYEYVIVASNMAGRSKASEVVFADKPMPPQKLAIKNFDMEDQFVELEWMKPPPESESSVPIKGYSIYYRELGTGAWVKGDTVPADKLSATMDVPKRGVVYEFQVTASNIIGESDPSEIVFADKAKPPVNLRVIDATGDSATISWDKPKKDDPQPREYVLEYKDKNTGNWVKGPTVDAARNRGTIRGIKGLTENGPLEVRVRAKNVAGISKPSEKISFGFPDPPENIRITAIKRNEDAMSLAWEDPTNTGGETLSILKYHIEYRKKGDAGPFKPGWSGTGDFHFADQPGLDFHKGDNYEFRMISENIIGRSKPSPIVFVDKTSPPQNLDITGMDQSKGELNLEWDPPANLNGGPVTNYVVEYRVAGKDEDQWEEKVVHANHPSYHFKDLKINTKYEFRVKAENIAGLSNPSNVASINKPSKPLNLKIESIDGAQGSGYFSWQKPEKDGGKEIEHYVFQYRERSRIMHDKPWSEKIIPVGMIVDKDNPFQHVPELWPLQHEALLEYRVMAVNLAGRSQASDIAFIDIPSPPQKVDVTGMDLEAGAVNLTWKPPKSDGGAKLKNYLLEYKHKDDDDWTEGKMVPANVLSGTIDDIPNLDSADYDFRVRATNMVGPSAGVIDDPNDSSVVSVGKPGVPEDFRVAKIDHPQSANGAVELKWSEPKENGGKPIKEYVVEYADVNSADWVEGQVVPHSMGQDQSVVLKLDLKGNKNYKYRVRARTMGGDGKKTEPLSIDLPSAPQNLFVKKMNVDHFDADLKWQKPSSDGGSEIDGYVIEYRKKDTGEWISAHSSVDVANNKGRQNLLRDIKDDVYEFRVKAKNMVGVGPPSASVFVSKPNVPKNPVLKIDYKTGEADLTWDEPDKITDGTITDITGYKIEHRVKGTQKWKATTVTEEEKHGVINGLDIEHKEYEFRVAAQNMAGYGNATEILSVAKPPPPKDLKINKMNHLDSAVNGSVELEWKPPDKIETPILEYTIQYKTRKEKQWTNGVTVKGDELKAIQMGLDLKNQDYMFQAIATNLAGPGNASNEDYAKKPGSPANLTIDELNYDEKKATLKWDPPEDTGGKDVDYVVEYKPKVDSWDNSKKIPVKGTSAEVPDLDLENKEYEYRVTAKNLAGASKPSEPVSVAKPKTPTNLKIKSLEPITGDATLTIDTPPKDENVTKYEIEIQDENNKKIKQRVDKDKFELDGSGKLVLPVKDLDPAKHDYTFKVKAANEAGFSDLSKPISIKKPEPPLNLKILKINNPQTNEATVQVTWDPPKSDGGSPIIGYSISYNDGTTQWIPHPEGETAATSALLSVPLEGKDSVGFKIKAHNMAGYSKFSEPVTRGKPGRPTHMKMKGRDALMTTAELEWKEPMDKGNSPIEGYLLEYRPKGTDEWQAGKPFGNVLTGKQKDLDLKENEYEFRLKAKNMFGYGDPSSTSSPSKPGPPEDVEILAMDLEGKNADLIWKIPKTEADVDKYIVEYRNKDTGGEWKEGRSVENRLNIKQDGVDVANELTEFHVIAENTAGRGPPSKSVFVRKPLKPKNVQILRLDPKKKMASLQWEKPDKNKDGDAEITGYKIEYRPKGVGVWKSSRTIPGMATFADVPIPDLDKKDYEFRMIAQNMAGNSDPTDEISMSKPGQPKDFKIKEFLDKDHDDTKDTALVEWKPPDPEKGKVDEYTVEYKPVGAGYWLPGAKVNGNQLKAEVPNLDLKNNNYAFRVVPSNAAGLGPASNVDSVGLPPEVPPIRLESMSYDSKSADLKWDEPPKAEGDHALEYIVEYKPKRSPWKDSQRQKATGNTATIKRLDLDDKNYDFRLIAKNIAGESMPSKPVTKVKPEAPVLQIKTMDLKNKVTTLTVPEPKDEVTKYEIEIKDEKKKAYKKVLDVKNLAKDPDGGFLLPVGSQDFDSHSYAYTVRAFNEAGYSPKSNVASIGKPGPPIIKITKINNPETKQASVEVTWQAPLNDGGSPILGYSLEYMDGSARLAGYGSYYWYPGEETGGKTLQVEQKVNLATAKMVGFKIRAYNKAGHGDYSNEVYADKPGVPENLEITGANPDGNTMDLAWNPPKYTGKVPIDGYTLQYRPNKTKDGRRTTDQEPWTSVDLPKGLKRTQDKIYMDKNIYEFRVQAKNWFGKGPFTPSVYAEKPPPPADAMTTAINFDDVRIKFTSGTVYPEDNKFPIIDYVIEYKLDNETEWKKGQVVPRKKYKVEYYDVLQEAHLKHLQFNHYIFRVRSRNLIGYSDATEPFTYNVYHSLYGFPSHRIAGCCVLILKPDSGTNILKGLSLKYGLKYNDTIYYINGFKVESHEDIGRVRDVVCKDTASHEFKIKRDGVDMTIYILRETATSRKLKS